MDFSKYTKMMLTVLLVFAIIMVWSAEVGTAIRPFPDGFLLQILRGPINSPSPDPCNTIPGQGSGQCP